MRLPDPHAHPRRAAGVVFGLVAVPVVVAVLLELGLASSFRFRPDLLVLGALAVGAAAVSGWLFGKMLAVEARTHWALWILPGVQSGSLALAVTGFVYGTAFGGLAFGLFGAVAAQGFLPFAGPGGMAAAWICAHRAWRGRHEEEDTETRRPAL